MTRLAIISDVHADVHALADALTQAERLGCDAVICAGDLVDYGLFPDETIALLRERAVPCIRGNHDRWRVAERTASDGGEDKSGLSLETLEFLTALPLKWDTVLDGVRVAMRHATPRSDMEGIYPGEASNADVERWLAEAQADVLIVGHTHQPFVLMTSGGSLIVNPGALLRAPGKNLSQQMVYNLERRTFELAPVAVGGTFGVLELPTRSFTVYSAKDGVEIEIPRLTVGVTDRRGR